MSTPTVERTGDWDSVPFSGGYAGLSDLADDEFSGMVTAGPTRLFMLRGSVIGILDGDIEDFEDADGTAREAPHPALPLLALMQERSDEVRAQYYTEETPISEVDRTLSDGNFTGYIELSENVLSGDYYQVFHQGHSMSVAYVGASERLIEDDEAFEQANDEVGIYEVRPVDIDVIEIPEPAGEDTDGTDVAGSGAAGAAASGATAAAVDEDAGTGTDDGASETEDAPANSDAAAAGSAAEPDVTEPTTDANTSEPATDADTSAPPAADEDGDADATESTASEEDAADGEMAADAGSTPDDPAAGGADPVADNGGATMADDPGESTGAGTASPEETASETNDGPTTSDAVDDGTASEQATASDSAEPTSGDGATGSGVGARRGEPAPDHPAAASRGSAGQRSGTSGGDDAGGALAPGDLEMRSLPSLDPARSASASKQERERRSATGGGVATGAAAGAATGAATEQAREPAGESSPETAEAGTAPGATAQDADRPADGATDASAGEPSADTASSGTGEGAPTDETTGDASAEENAAGAGAAASAAGGTAAAADLEDAEADVERLESELAELEGEHEDVVAERDRLESELAEAREEIERLRDRLEEATGQAGAASTKLSPREAIDETNLFIRYDSKGEATLEKAHAGEVDKDAVDENLRLEYHTSFDADDASVDGVGFDKFLTETVQYRFVDWLVRTLLYEIRDTGNTGAMAELYDALPKVDRAELNGQVTVKYTEDGQEHRSQIGFDVIVRDRMGNPLIVANLNDSRDPATDSMMTDLVRAAERVGETSQSLAGGILVTRSFFEPAALETAEEATAGGLLSRGKQKSFVNLSRTGGYHLCLVEARNDEFHLAVPEL